ncbi:hypothetical protein GGS26DRAFT_570654 [Hypomontagnella submonticulosa]|nr:hypothetical protein GGS26DRAFT_570654 [Hypomontagnella submonticulosa]
MMQSNDRDSPPQPVSRPGRAESFKRRSTHDSTHVQQPSRSQSFLTRAKNEKKAAMTKKYQESYPVYAGLRWEVLRSYLLQKWPNEEFKELRRDDKWVFETPQPLSDEDKRILSTLRDDTTPQQDGQRGQRESVSPEP